MLLDQEILKHLKWAVTPMDFEGMIRESLIAVVLPHPSQAQNDRILFIGIGQLPRLFVMGKGHMAS